MTENQPTSMQRDQRVLRHSVVSAFWGWLSTYIVYLMLTIVQTVVFGSEDIRGYTFYGLLLFLIGPGVGSFLVTLTGWIFLGMPIAAFISDRQARSFKFMIAIHTIATVLVVIGPSLIGLLLTPREISFGELLIGLLFNFLTIWAAAIGVIGGTIFCSLERRN